MGVTEIQICFICGQPSIGKDLCDGCGGGQPSETHIPTFVDVIEVPDIGGLQGA